MRKTKCRQLKGVCEGKEGEGWRVIREPGEAFLSTGETETGAHVMLMACSSEEEAEKIQKTKWRINSTAFLRG